ncbi:Transmembrane protein, partial [Pleurotus pulmonarius]
FGEGNGTLSYAFEGTAIAFYGHADGQLQASIDGASPTYHPPGLQFQIYQPWFNIADLADTHHAITLDFSTNVYFDYAVISAGQSTPLQGRRILVDDSDAAMNYTGTWSVESDQMFATGDGLQQIPHGRSVHRSTKAGDYVLLQFTGSSISVYGIVQWQNTGRISTAYTLDGSASPHTTTISSDGQRNPYTDQPNYLFFHADLAPGNHTLVVTVTEITDRQSLLLDYVLYTAAFDSLAAMPALTPGDIHPWTPPRVVRAKKAFPTGAIVGAAVGAAVLLALVVFLVYRTTRRRRPKSSGDRPEIDPLPEPVVRPSEPPSYTPTPTISLYQPSHTDVGASSLGGHAYPRGSSLAGTSSSTSHARSSKSEKHARESVVIHQTHHPRGARQSYPAPHVYAYGSGIHELQMSPTDINVYRA